jgi:hypothetical protein
MDQLLIIPRGRKPQKQTLLCALMAVTALIVLNAFGTPPRTPQPMMQPAAYVPATTILIAIK